MAHMRALHSHEAGTRTGSSALNVRPYAQPPASPRPWPLRVHSLTSRASPLLYSRSVSLQLRAAAAGAAATAARATCEKHRASSSGRPLRVRYCPPACVMWTARGPISTRKLASTCAAHARQLTSSAVLCCALSSGSL